MKIKITYIHHSSFCVELDNTILLFDYYKGELPKFDNNKKLYIFASHSHADHFNESIFDIGSKHNNTTYILSDDIKVEKKDNIQFIKENENICVDEIKIETLKSTDLGVAFIVKVEDKCIYHAGDLNWWHWEGEDPAENANMEKMYKEEISKIKGREFDVAFITLDARQEKDFYLGFDEFMKNTNTKVAFPMHCSGDYSLTKKLSEMDIANSYKDRIMHISNEN
ncbi:MAG: MBL fold metallo-hydrolase [Paraclostridium sp.]